MAVPARSGHRTPGTGRHRPRAAPEPARAPLPPEPHRARARMRMGGQRYLRRHRGKGQGRAAGSALSRCAPCTGSPLSPVQQRGQQSPAAPAPRAVQEETGTTNTATRLLKKIAIPPAMTSHKYLHPMGGGGARSAPAQLSRCSASPGSPTATCGTRSTCGPVAAPGTREKC